jgi:peptidoglycan/LPS O-acetylase OafA/YrhL
MHKPTTVNWEILSITRFILAFIVVAGHLSSKVDNQFLKTFNYLGSFEAILGFLLISGLSIGKSISRNKENYFKRRIQRIYPVYLASLTFGFFVYYTPITLTYIGYLLFNFVFLNQVFTSSSLVGPAWTLALEVWLYALAPLFLKCNLRLLLTMVYVSFIAYCAYTCGRTLYHFDYYSGTMYGINLLLLSFIWIAGFALAIFPDQKRLISINILLIFFAHWGLTILIQSVFRWKHHELDLLLKVDLIQFIGKTICLTWVYSVVILNHKFKAVTGKIKTTFTILGNISYPLYLIHSASFDLLMKFNIDNAPLMVFFALALAYLFYLGFDSYSKKREKKVTLAV